METMYDRIKNMNLAEMRRFCHAVYLAGVKDGEAGEGYDDLPFDSYFGGWFLTLDKEEVMPNNNVYDLWDKWELNDKKVIQYK